MTDTMETGTTRKYVRAAVAGGLGTVFEQYDFLMFGTAAGLVFNKLFFPSFDPRIGILLSFVTYGTGSIARPIGGVVIAHFGDRLGRKKMLTLTLGMAGLATALIGCLPGYATIGIWAPVLLTALRVIQGFFLGGEQGGAFVLVSEYVPAGRRGRYSGLVTGGSPAGQFLGVLAFFLASKAPDPAFMSWAWRIPFLVSLVLIAIALYIRRGLAETPAFTALASHHDRARAPFIEVLRTSLRKTLLGAGINVGSSVMIYITITFALSYLNSSLGLSKSATLVVSLVGAAGQFLTTLGAAQLSDRLGRTKVMLASSLLGAVFVVPFFLMLQTRNLLVITIAMVVAMGLQGGVFGPMAAYYSELFETRVRYTGVAMTFSLGVLIGGGLAPSVATGLYTLSGGQWWPVACVLVVGALITTGSLLGLRNAPRSEPSAGEPGTGVEAAAGRFPAEQ